MLASVQTASGKATASAEGDRTTTHDLSHGILSASLALVTNERESREKVSQRRKSLKENTVPEFADTKPHVSNEVGRYVDETGVAITLRMLLFKWRRLESRWRVVGI